MTSTEQGYTTKYQKQKSHKNKSTSPSHPNLHSTKNQLGTVVQSLTQRIDDMQIKITNIVNIVKLLQKYTQTKDIQYQKQKQNQSYLKNISNHLNPIEIQTKLTQFQSLSQKLTTQILFIQTLHNNFTKSHETPPQTQHPSILSHPIQSTTIPKKYLMIQIQQLLNKMQLNLREELNKKIDICMKLFSTISQQYNQHQNQSYSAINTIMIHQQLNNIKLTMNKLQSDCNRNKMITQAKLSQFLTYLSSQKKRKRTISIQQQYQQPRISSTYHHQLPKQTQLSQRSTLSKKSKKQQSNKSNKSYKNKHQNKIIKQWKIQSHHKNSTRNPIQQLKNIKQIQLKQAIRKKKQNQIKLNIFS